MNKVVNWISRFLWHSGISTLARHILVRNGRFVLEFHGISQQRYFDLPRDVQPYFSQAELVQALTWLSKRFDFLTPGDFLAGIKPGILLTFDDGLANNFDCALPVLEQFKAPAIFFVTTQHVQEPTNWLPANYQLAERMNGRETDLAHQFFNGMSEAQLQQCGHHPLITIGGHTHTHPFLTQLEASQLHFELKTCKTYLAELTGQTVDFFAYPAGDYNSTVARAVANIGYRAAFVERSKKLGLGPFEIPRIGLYQSDSAYLALKLSGLHQPPIKALRIP